jgi:hypothetical protein
MLTAPQTLAPFSLDPAALLLGLGPLFSLLTLYAVGRTP